MSKYIFVHHGNHLSEDLWSGTPLNIVRTLRSLGHEVLLIDQLKFPMPLGLRVKTALYRRLRSQFYLPTRDPRVMRHLARETNRRIRDAGAVEAVVCTFPADAAYLETESPLILIHDATWVQLDNYYPGHERNARETHRGGRTLDQLAYERCDHAILSSRWALDSVVSEYGVPASKLSLASFGASLPVEPTRENVASYLQRRGVAPMKLLFLGVDWNRKGGDIAVQVAQEIERMGVEVEVHVVGCEPHGEMPPFVRTHGKLYKNRPEEAGKLFELFESSDYLILPTRADATPVVFCEAAAYGLPVMTRDTGGVSDVVKGGWALALLPDASPGEFARWAIDHYRDRRSYDELCWLARDCFETNLNWPAFCRNLVKVAASLQSPQHEATPDPAESTVA